MSLQVENLNTVYLYNHVRGQFVAYSLEIVNPKLRELQPGDISRKELDNAFKAARKAFNPATAAKKWSDAAPAAGTTADSDEPEIPEDMGTAIDDFLEEDDES